jgi:hypothetical protein
VPSSRRSAWIAWDLVGGDTGGRDASPPLAELLKPSEVARMLGVSRAWLYDAAKDGRVPCVRSRAARLAALARDALVEGERFGPLS